MSARASLEGEAGSAPRFDRRFPTWVEVLLVVHCLGYRKVEDPKPVTPRPTRKEKKR